MGCNRTAFALALLVALCPTASLAQTPPPPAAVDPAVAEAQARFFAGQKAYADKSYEQALLDLRASYAAVPSPNSHLYVARCLRQLGRVAEAYDTYSQVILESADRLGAEQKYEATQKAASAERAALRDKIATLVVTLPADAPGARLYLGADEVPAARWNTDLTVLAGDVNVRAEAPGRAPFNLSFTLAGGGKKLVTVELPAVEAVPVGPVAPPPPKAAPLPGFLRPVAYAAAGVGVVGLVVGGALGAKASSRYDALAKTCGGRCGPSHQGEVDAGRAETAGSRAGLAIGVVGVAAGATIWTFDYLGRRDRARVGSLTVRIAPSPREPGVDVGGSF